MLKEIAALKRINRECAAGWCACLCCAVLLLAVVGGSHSKEWAGLSAKRAASSTVQLDNH